jgi:hypothetical protein
MSRKNWSNDKLFTRLLENKSDKTYWDNIQELHSRTTDDVFARCCELIKSSSQKENIIGIDVLSQLGLERPFQKETLQLYFALLEKELETDVIMSILFGIGHNNYETLDESQTVFLSNFKNNSKTEVRYGLVHALLGVEHKPAVESLIFLTGDKISWIRDWATFGIGTQIDRNNKTIREALWKRVNDKHQDTKLEAIAGLAKRKDIRVKEIIKRELLDGEYGILLFEAIEELNDKDFLPLLNANLEKAEKDKTINTEWIDDLKRCIERLNKR